LLGQLAFVEKAHAHHLLVFIRICTTLQDIFSKKMRQNQKIVRQLKHGQEIQQIRKVNFDWLGRRIARGGTHQGGSAWNHVFPIRPRIDPKRSDSRRAGFHHPRISTFGQSFGKKEKGFGVIYSFPAGKIIR
jgi:hypothetical protein